MSIFDVFKKDKREKPEKSQPSKTLEEGLEKTKSNFFNRLGKAMVGKSTVDIELLDELEEILVSADVGVETTVKIIDRLETRVAKDKYLNLSELNNLLREEIKELMIENKQEDVESFEIPKDIRPYVIMVVGVNGVGKTTTIGKLASKFKDKGYNVLLGAADTFRAAAIDQLHIWSERAGVPIVSKQMGSDPASVSYETVQKGVKEGADIILLDTAGRLHNKVNLMNELSKIKRVMKKIIPEAPHEILLVLDASTGQNAIEQAKQFIKATEVNAIALTKLDGTAKGGVVIGIVDQLKIPVKFVGVGEQIDDLKVFDKNEFVDSLFKDAEKFAQ